MSSSSSPCAACKLLRRKCTQGCVFAPYFPPDTPAKFSNVHRVFGASNVSKLLTELPPAQREDAVNSLAYEAEARLRDPVYGCVNYIQALQLRVAQAREELAAARKELAGYIGPAAFAPQPPLQYHHLNHPSAQYAVMAPPQQMAQLQQQHHHRQLAEAQQLAAAVEVAREQDMMMRHHHAYANGNGAATVAVVPPDAAAAYDGGGFIFHHHHQPPLQAQTYQIEPSPPPSSGQSHAEEVSPRQQHTDGSDEGSGGGVVAPA